MKQVDSKNLKDYIWETITTQLDEFAATVEIAEVLKINENYVEDLVEKNELKPRYDENGKKTYKIKDFVDLFSYDENFKIYEEYCAYDTLYNFAINFHPKNPLEAYYEDYLVRKLGEFARVKDVAELLCVSKNMLYEEIANGAILALPIGTRRIVITRSLIYYFRKISEM